jgi:2-polyprenyl-6-methoxyphenol hydroxylase-like FAD-dependent oxidoreductase
MPERASEAARVLIVGAGLGGLSTAVFLGLHGVPAVVVERHAGLSVQPKARGQNPVTMEALRTAGLDDKLRAAAPPGSEGQFIIFARSVAGPVTGSLPAGSVDLSAFSPATAAGASQESAERLLAARAAELGTGIRFRHEVISFEQDSGGVTALLRDLAAREEYTVRAQYMVSADGHRGWSTRQLGVGTHGRRVPRASATLFVQFEADLDQYTKGASFGFYVLQNPELPRGQATLCTTDYPHRYVLGMTFDDGSEDDDPADYATRTVDVIRTACGVPGLEVTLLDSSWSNTGVHLTRVADTFRHGRVFLVGDAAHLMPPSGGMAGNTAILDGYHLAWKLAAVLNGTAGAGLLDSYDAERRPLGDAIAEQQFANLARRHVPELLDDTVAKTIDARKLMFGFVCPSGAFVPAGQAARDGVSPTGAAPLFENPRVPTGRPGTRAPHVPLGHDGAVSTRDLFRTGFVILTKSAAWASAAAEAGERLGLLLDIHLIGDSGPLADPDDRFLRAYQIAADGAVLVRPDGIIGWQCTGHGDADDLEHALRAILDRAGRDGAERPSHSDAEPLASADR